MNPVVRSFKKLRYFLDNLYSQGTGVMILSLGALTLLIILAAAIALTLTGLAPGEEASFSFSEAFWLGLLRTLGSGSIGGRETGWGFRFLMLGVTLSSIFVFSSLIGVLTTGMNARLEELRKGRSEVMEIGHTVILGWSEQIYTIIRELVDANAGEAHPCLVIMGEREKAEMEAAIRQKVGRTGRMRIVCRTGNPLEMADLRIVNLNTARSILVLSPESSNPDADVFKVILAILNHPNRRKQPYHIVASLRNSKNTAAAHVIGKDEVTWVRMGDTIARIIAQTSRQSGLSIVYTELLDFNQNEIYFHKDPALVGKTFGQALMASEEDTVIGIQPAGGKPRMNPPMDTRLEPEDQLIVIAQDNRVITFDPSIAPVIQKERIARRPQPKRAPERTLILGWNWRGAVILHELDHYVAPGSEALIVADQAGTQESLARDCQDLVNQTVCYQPGDTTDRQVIEDLALQGFDHIILLSYCDRLSVQQADAQTIITLLHLRDLADLKNLKYSIVTEMMDVRNRKLAVVARPDDFIVSDRLISLMMAQVTENPGLNAVFEDLFDPNSAELYLKPAGSYVRTGKETNFYTVLEAARQRDEVAIGYRLAAAAQDPQRAYGVVINPSKPAEVTFCEQDRIIVLANS